MVAAAGFAPAQAIKPSGFWVRRVCVPPHRENWCGQREMHPHGLAPAGFSSRRVYLFRHVRIKMEHPQGRAPCSLPYHGSPSLSTGWMQNWSKRKDSHLRSPLGRRIYSALQLLLCHASKWGLGWDSHPRPSPYEGAALTAAPPSHGGPPR